MLQGLMDRILRRSRNEKCPNTSICIHLSIFHNQKDEYMGKYKNEWNGIYCFYISNSRYWRFSSK